MRHLLYLALVSSLALPSHAFAGDWRSVGDNKLIRERAKEFAVELHAIGSTATVANCHHVVREAEGRVGSAWAGICQINVAGKAQPVLLCNDDAVGYFSLTKGTFIDSDEYAGQFMEHNCMGG